MKWVITGGCGFIGTNLVEAILDQPGNTICIVDNLSVGTRDALGTVAAFDEIPRGRVLTRTSRDAWQRNELLVGDIRDRELASAVVRGADVIVHLAASTGILTSIEDPLRDCEENVLGTLHYLEAARDAGVPRFVLASSGAAIGECEPPIHEDLPARPVAPYGASKVACEAYCSAYFKTFGIESAVLRFSNVYGPRSSHKSSVVASFVRRALGGETLLIFGDGGQTRDFIYVSDLVDAVIRAATRDRLGAETFQIATNEETSILALAHTLNDVLRGLGCDPAPIVHGAQRRGDVRRNFSDTSRARTGLGWHARVPLADGLARTVRWFMACAPQDPGVAQDPGDQLERAASSL